MAASGIKSRLEKQRSKWRRLNFIRLCIFFHNMRGGRFTKVCGKAAVKTFDGSGAFSYVCRMISTEPNINTTEMGLVPRYPLQKPPSRGLEGSGGEMGGGRRFEGRRGLHLRKASRGLEGFKAASRGLQGGLKKLEGCFTFGRLQGGLKEASRGLHGGFKGA